MLYRHGQEAHQRPEKGGKGNVRVQIWRTKVQLRQKSNQPQAGDCYCHVRGWHDPQKEDEIMAKRGLYANIQAKRKRIAAGSGEKMRKPGTKGAPTAAAFRAAAKTAKKRSK
jgi:hypothetical protein